MSGLELQRESLDYYNNTNYYEYLEKWSDGYQQRLKAINFFVSEYGFTVDSKHQSDLDEVLQEASSIEKTEEKEQQIQDMVKNANWQKNEEKSDSDYMVYEATITNTTNDTFSAFWISVNELDSNGVITDSTSSNTVNNWAPGSAVKFSYSVSSDTASVEYNAEFSVE